MNVRGLINLQLASKDERIWVLEANPRASRTVPFVSKVTGVPLAKVATSVLLGRTLAEMRDSLDSGDGIETVFTSAGRWRDAVDRSR